MSNELEKATARPWHVGSGSDYENGKWPITAIYDQRCVYVCSASADIEVIGHDERRANAALIVKAVNEFEALNAVVEIARSLGQSTNGLDKAIAALDQLRKKG